MLLHFAPKRKPFFAGEQEWDALLSRRRTEPTQTKKAIADYLRRFDRASSRNSYRRLASQNGKSDRHVSVTSGRP